MEKIKYEFNDGTISEVEVSDEIYEVLKVESRPFEREEKRKQRRGLSLEQFLEDNDYEIEDDSQNLDRVLDYIFETKNELEQKKIRQKKLRLKKLYQGMKTLTDKQANAIYKRYFLKITITKIAEEEQISKQTIDERIKSALKKLKKFF